ncbi:MAG: hypothetical protein CVT68_12495, partial [Actinobacteria bacterium HGW-Actinobacteria-8]
MLTSLGDGHWAKRDGGETMRAGPDKAPGMVEQQHGTEEVTALVRHWLIESRAYPIKGSAALLAGLLREEGGLAFLTQFVDGVIRPEDARVAARNFRAMAARDSHFLPTYQRVLLRLGSWASRVLPGLVVAV